MENKNFLLSIIGVILIVSAGYWFFTRDNAKVAESSLPKYFMDSMIERGVEDIGMPIEGFDFELLKTAYPEIVDSDFNGVKTLEGEYKVINGEVTFERGDAQPISTAERTLSEEGYATLLLNISQRLGMKIESKEDVDRLISSINTAERVELSIAKEKGAFGVRLTPVEVVEDSRCPMDVTCIQAGTLRLKAILQSGLGTTTQIFVLNEPITTEAETVTLINVIPQAESAVTIKPADYVFVFEIKKR